MSTTLSPEVKALVDRPNFAHLATLLKEGAPQCAPVWIGRDGDRILVCTSEETLKARNARRDSRVAISIVDFENPYEEAQIQGRVVEFRPDSDLQQIDAVSRKYTGKEFPMRSREGRVVLVIEPARVKYQKIPFRHTPAA